MCVTEERDQPAAGLFPSAAVEADAELGPPTWNFNKYLLDRGGRPVKHFEVGVEPDDPELTSAIDAQLKS